ncbi:MBL fold metallo-hydrolase [Amycolatopsis panacis]|uniref:Beta-Casp domain-containing protein n=1 Tax=Amycolatopsis panacis TaxID=2340917 RepID=A0A419I6T4_9PSEU|nr:hypothetical protein [Amycolatopsis panacis]RJQ87248.1 hypothetical protein D5S19_09960 [Amycolatopsis panacis]
MLLTFTGAGVLIETPENRILWGCGGEGPRPSGLDAVVLPDATLARCGGLPVLAGRGWAGPVYASARTIALVPPILAEAARANIEDEREAAAVGWPGSAAAFGEVEAKRAAALLTCPDPGAFGPGLRLEFGDAGGVAGASWARLRVGERVALFAPVLGVKPEPRPSADTVVLTVPPYHDGEAPDAGRLAGVVHRAVARGGSVLIAVSGGGPVAVVEATLAELMAEGAAPRLPIVRDSALEPAIRPTVATPGAPHVVLAGPESGAAGRARALLARMLPDPRHAVVFAGPVAPETPAARLTAGARQVKLLGRYLPARAEITRIGDFGVTARDREFLAWAAAGPVPGTAFVLGEPARATVLARTLHAEENWCAVVPSPGERVLC